MEKIEESILSFLRTRPPAEELFKELLKSGNIYLIGGVLREFLDNNGIKDLRDIDVVIKINDRNLWDEIIDKYSPSRNKFSGYKFLCSGLIFDVWPINDTWAYKEGIIKINNDSEYLKKLQDTVFLNMDSIVYDFSNAEWYKEKYEEAMESKVIDVVLKKNPQIVLNIVRMFVIKNRYNMTISDNLKSIIVEARNEFNSKEAFIDELEKVQKRRYKTIYLDRKTLIKELENILYD